MSRCETAARRALIYLGPPHDLGGVVHVLKIEPELSTFGAPTPEALDQCIPGVGRYARKMPIPFTLDELLQELPDGLIEAARHSNCVKYAFYTSRVDPR